MNDEKFLSVCDNVIVFPLTGSPDQLASKEEEAYADFGARQLSKILSESESETTDHVKSLEGRQMQATSGIGNVMTEYRNHPSLMNIFKMTNSHSEFI